MRKQNKENKVNLTFELIDNKSLNNKEFELWALQKRPNSHILYSLRSLGRSLGSKKTFYGTTTNYQVLSLEAVIKELAARNPNSVLNSYTPFISTREAS